MTEHTPTPWKMDESGNMTDAKGKPVGYLNGSAGSPKLNAQTKANQAFILRAVNCHEEMLALLKEAYTDDMGMQWFRRLKQAIAKAEGR